MDVFDLMMILITGNLPIVAMCDVCDEECSFEPELLDWWCCWCQRCSHETCKSSINDVNLVY